LSGKIGDGKCVVLENIPTHPGEGYFKSQNWNFQRDGGSNQNHPLEEYRYFLEQYNGA